MNKKQFISNCTNLNSDIVVQQHLIDGSSYFFDTFYPNQEFHFKNDIAKSLKVHIRDIVIVGSGKLGFSIKPSDGNLSNYNFFDFDHNFNKNNEEEKSDLDIAIVSGKLFDEQLIELHRHTKGYSDQSYNNRKQGDFAKYILKGWFRPDKIPNDYSITSDVTKVQEEYRSQYGRKIKFGLYKSWYFFESYHENNINRIKLNLIANKSI